MLIDPPITVTNTNLVANRMCPSPSTYATYPTYPTYSTYSTYPPFLPFLPYSSVALYSGAFRAFVTCSIANA